MKSYEILKHTPHLNHIGISLLTFCPLGHFFAKIGFPKSREPSQTTCSPTWGREEKRVCCDSHGSRRKQLCRVNYFRGATFPKKDRPFIKRWHFAWKQNRNTTCPPTKHTFLKTKMEKTLFQENKIGLRFYIWDLVDLLRRFWGFTFSGIRKKMEKQQLSNRILAARVLFAQVF